MFGVYFQRIIPFKDFLAPCALFLMIYDPILDESNLSDYS